MIRMRLDNGNYLFGITADNVKRWREGKPMVIDLAPLGGEGTILIMYADTNAQLIDEVADLPGMELSEQDKQQMLGIMDDFDEGVRRVPTNGVPSPDMFCKAHGHYPCTQCDALKGL